MGKGKNGKILAKGITQRADGKYMARATVNGQSICIYDNDYDKLLLRFELRKKQLEHGIEEKKYTLNEFFEEWFVNYKIPQIKESSIAPLKNRYKSTFGEVMGDRLIDKISQLDVQKAINLLVEEGKSKSAIKEGLSMMQACFDVAQYNYLIERNPCFQINFKWEEKKRPTRYLSTDEINIFLGEAKNSWYYELLYVMIHSGMRIGEVGALQWNDINLDDMVINVKASLTCQYIGGGKIQKIGSTKTVNSVRSIPMFKGVREAFISQKTKQRQRKDEMGDKWRADDSLGDLVFTSSFGSPVTRYIAQKEINKIVDEINYKELKTALSEKRAAKEMEHVYPHALRHTFCSICFKQGLSPKYLQEIMGHKSLSTTMDIYTHFMDESKEEVEKFNNANILDFE